MLGELESVLQADIPGDVVEFGCYIGTTSLFIRRLLDAYTQAGERRFYAYDSFEGLPPKTAEDLSPAGEQFKSGALQVSKKRFLQEFRRARLVPPITHKGWFNELTDKQLPEAIAFAFLDGDFYGSILDSLRLVVPRLTPGAVISIDDYDRAALPGVARATAAFFRGSVHLRAQSGIGVIRKPA